IGAQRRFETAGRIRVRAATIHAAGRIPRRRRRGLATRRLSGSDHVRRIREDGGRDRKRQDHYVWTDKCSDREWEILVEMALGEEVTEDRRRAALQSLLRKEIVEKGQNGYRLSVEMFGLWILRNQIGTDDLRRETPVTVYGHH